MGTKSQGDGSFCTRTTEKPGKAKGQFQGELIVELGSETYYIRGMTIEQIKACIQEIKDLGFIHDAVESDSHYVGYTEHMNKSIQIEYNYVDDEEFGGYFVWITAFRH